ncbi:MAG: hypothetical protein KBS91_01465, partial [Firmicutes bacterium]|nr:hypothetical protein [Candidatus Caballimonas caccae]
MKYNKAKRVLSVISSILGLIFTIGAVAVVALGVMDLIGENKKFAIGDSLDAFGVQMNFSSDLIKWIIYVVIFILAYINVMLILKLLKKPMCVNGKFKKVGWTKVFFSILTIVFGVVIALQFFSKEIVEGEKMKMFIVMGVAVVVAILQIVSMFLKVQSNKELKKAEKEVPELIEEPKEEILNAPETEVAVKEVPPQLSVFNTVANDPVADGFEQRIREIRHLREAGLINDEQTTAAVEKIIYGFTKTTK